MLLSQELKKLNIENECIQEREFSSLGLAAYNDGHDVCTFLVASKYYAGLSSGISMVLTTRSIYEELEQSGSLSSQYGFCLVQDPRNTYFLLHNELCKNNEYKRPEFDTWISESARISRLAYIADKNVKIGNNVVIEEFVSIKENTVIGDNCIIRAGSVLGGPGFEVKHGDEGLWVVTHVGGVILGHDVEIQQLTNIDKAIYPWDNTILGDYCKINSQVQIAHGVKMGKNCEVVANAGIEGRVQIGDNVWIGPNSAIRNGIKIGDNARVNIGAVATLDVPAEEAVSGNFAISHDKLLEHVKKLSGRSED